MMRSSGVIGIATALSRVLGFVRDIIFANFFGTSMIAQAFVVAFRIPNTLRDMVGEGATNSAIVPVLSEYKTLHDQREFVRASQVLLNIAIVTLSAAAVLGIIFSPMIVRIMAPGFISEPEKFQLTVTLNRVMFPYLVLIGLTAYSMGILNAMKHFAAPAFGPSLMNIMLIISMVWLYPKIGVMGLAIGVLAGGAVQLAFNFPVMQQHGVSINFKEGFHHAAVKRIGKLLLPRTLGSAVYQINIFVDTILASLSSVVGAGGVAALYYSNRLIQFPLAIFGLAIAQAALPKMSQEFAANDIERLKDTLAFSMRVVFLIMLPASFALAILGEPIIKILFQRGEFTAYSTAITQSALFFYSFGILAFAGIKLLVTTFYAMHDTVTPVKTAFVAVLINAGLSVILMWPMRLGGLALATTISASFNLVNLYMILKKRIGDFGTKDILDSFFRVLAASIVMTVVLKIMMAAYPKPHYKELCLYIIAGTVTFSISSYLFGVREVREFLVWISKRK